MGRLEEEPIQGEGASDLEELMGQMRGLDRGLVGDDGELVIEPMTQTGRLKNVDKKRELVYLKGMDELEGLRKAMGNDTVTIGTGDERVLVFWRPKVKAVKPSTYSNVYLSKVKYLAMCKEGFFELRFEFGESEHLNQGSLGNFINSTDPFKRAKYYNLNVSKYGEEIAWWHDLIKEAAASNGQINRDLFKFRGSGVQEHLFLVGIPNWDERELVRIEDLQNSRLVQERYGEIRRKMKELEKRTREETAFLSGEDAPEEIAEKPKRKNEERRNWFQSIWWRIWGRR